MYSTHFDQRPFISLYFFCSPFHPSHPSLSSLSPLTQLQALKYLIAMWQLCISTFIPFNSELFVSYYYLTQPILWLSLLNLWSEPATFVSAVLLVAATMLRLGLPHINVLSKVSDEMRWVWHSILDITLNIIYHTEYNVMHNTICYSTQVNQIVFLDYS